MTLSSLFPPNPSHDIDVEATSSQQPVAFQTGLFYCKYSIVVPLCPPQFHLGPQTSIYAFSAICEFHEW